MPPKDYTIVIGIVIAIIVLLIAASFIFILVTLSNNRKRQFIQEKKNLELHFNEQLLQSQLEIQEQVFNSISREIHDNVGQTLSLAKVQLNLMETGNGQHSSLLVDIKESISNAMLELRDIAKSLDSDRVVLGSLTELTHQELKRIARLGTIETAIHISGTELNVDDRKKLIAYRIIQESLQNILKHARASKIEVSFYFDHTGFKFEVKDNGVGFIQNETGKKDGLGLKNMLSRATLIGGQGSIHSVVNKGTTITINIPYA